MMAFDAFSDLFTISIAIAIAIGTPASTA